MDDAEQAAERQHAGQQAACKDPALLPAPADAMVDGQPAQTKGEHCAVLARILQHAQAPLLGGGILHGHQCKGQRGNHHKGNAPGGADEVEAGVLPRAHRHGRKDEHRHVEPPGIVAGIEGIERAVQDGHQRKYHADGNDPLFAVALPGTPVGHHTGQTAQGQIGCHAGPFDDALRPDGGHIGGIRGQHPAQQDGQILLGLGIGQKAPAGGKVDGARVLQYTEDSGPEHHKAQCHAQQALKSQLTKEAGREPELPGGELAGEVDDKEEHLPHKEEVVVEQVHRHPEGEPTVAVLVDGLIQCPEHPGEEGQHIDEVVEEDVVQPPARKGVESRTQHRKIRVFDVAAQVQIRAAARHRELEHQQRHHEVGEPVLREEQGKPEEGGAVQVERIGVHGSAAQVSCPGKGVLHAPVSGGVACPLEEAVHIAVKADLLAVEIACIVEKAAVQQIERQEDEGGCQGAEPHGEPELVLLLPQHPGR